MRWKNRPATRVGVLVGVEDVGAVAVQQLRERRDDAPLVGARDEQRRGARGAGPWPRAFYRARVTQPPTAGKKKAPRAGP